MDWRFERDKALNDRDAANEVREKDKNGDGKLSKDEWLPKPKTTTI